MAWCRLTGFVACDRGGGTILGLFWFILLVGICGLAVDITDGLRNRTMLQSTADAAALAAAMDLPNANSAVASAVTYAGFNHPGKSYGAVLRPGDVEIGVWDEKTRTFLKTGFAPGTPLDAVRVTVNQTAANGNSVPTNFLRIIGLQSWDVRAMAVAQAFTPKCLRNGLVARGIVNISSNNAFVRKICIHGQQGVQMQNGNYYEEGVEVSMPNLNKLVIPTQGMTSNPGLPAALRETSKQARMVNQLDRLMADYLNPASGIHAPYINTALPVITINENFNFNLIQVGRIYHVVCAPAKSLNIPNGFVLVKVVIISECNIQISKAAKLADVVLGSRSLGGSAGHIDKATIDAPAQSEIGLPDNCAPGGGVVLLSNASMQFSSSTLINGVTMVARGNIELSSLSMGINGISAEAGKDIKMSANNMFGLCQSGGPEIARKFHWRLVR